MSAEAFSPDFVSTEEPTRRGPLRIGVFGDKGVAKTVAASSICYGTSKRRGFQYLVDFDKQTEAVWRGFFGRDPHMRVIDGMARVDPNPKKFLESSAENMQYLEASMDWILANGGADGVVLDGVDLMTKCAEMRMRYHAGVAESAKIMNPSRWDDRNRFVRKVCDLAERAARCVVVYVAYPKSMEMDAADDEPPKAKWPDVIGRPLDIVFHAVRQQKLDGKGGYSKRYLLITETSKRTDLIGELEVIDHTSFEWPKKPGNLGAFQERMAKAIGLANSPALNWTGVPTKAKAAVSSTPLAGAKTTPRVPEGVPATPPSPEPDPLDALPAEDDKA